MEKKKCSSCKEEKENVKSIKLDCGLGWIEVCKDCSPKYDSMKRN